LRFNGIYCIYHCNVEQDEEDDVEQVDMYWSDASTWEDTDAGRPPTNGEDLVIPRSWNLILDIEQTPILAKVTVFGGITFGTDS